MDRKLLYDNFAQFEKDTTLSLERLRQLKEDVEILMEENTTLHIENQNLRDRLDELERVRSKDSEPSNPEMTKSRLNLEKIYEEGFHVCNLFYGSRRVEDEPCAFCLDVIYGERRLPSCSFWKNRADLCTGFLFPISLLHRPSL